MLRKFNRYDGGYNSELRRIAAVVRSPRSAIRVSDFDLYFVAVQKIDVIWQSSFKFVYKLRNLHRVLKCWDSVYSKSLTRRSTGPFGPVSLVVRRRYAPTNGARVEPTSGSRRCAAVEPSLERTPLTTFAAAPAWGCQAGKPSFQPTRGCRSTRAPLGVENLHDRRSTSEGD